MIAPSWFHNALNAAKQLYVEQGKDFILEQLRSVNGINAVSRKIEKDKEYVTIRLRSSRIVDVRRWTSTLYGSIRSRVTYLHGDHGLVDLQRIVTPEKMREFDPANIDRVVQVDKPIVGPVPYVGEISLELGLFSVKGTDLTAPYLDLLSDLAERSGVTAASAALTFAEPLRRGVDLLFGNNEQARLEIGIDKNWTELTTGTWVMMRAEKGTVNLADLWLGAEDLALTRKDGKPFRQHPYIIFSIEASSRRDDWMMIPDLKAAWDSVGLAIRKGDVDKAEQLLRQFSLMARLSADLVPDDAERLARKGQEHMRLIQPETVIALSDTDQPFPDYADLNLYESTN